MVFQPYFIIVVDLMSTTNKKYYIPVIVWAVLIITVSSIPYLGPPPFQFTWSDKVEHFIEYSFLGFFMAYALAKTRPRPLFWVAVIICGAYGIIDELHQLYIPGRVCDPFDALADILGGAAGAGIYLWLKHRFVCLSFRQAPVENIK